jgi:hypothetical protein
VAVESCWVYIRVVGSSVSAASQHQTHSRCLGCDKIVCRGVALVGGMGDIHMTVGGCEDSELWSTYIESAMLIKKGFCSGQQSCLSGAKVKNV